MTLPEWNDDPPDMDEWFDMMCDSYAHPPAYHNARRLPAFPPDPLQANTTGQAGIATLKEAFIFYQDCIGQFQLMGKPPRQSHRLLDFGTGWGRICRFFLRELPVESIFGIDVTPEFIEICKTDFQSGNFFLTTPFPPAPLPSASFDFVVGFSVFSHLSEAACAAWMQEFHRILAPGGVVALTTRGRNFLDICESMKSHDFSGYQQSMSLIFDNYDDARARYDRGEFLHSNIDGVSGGGAMNATFYGETFIPEAYARSAYAKWFKLENFLFNPARQTHPIMFFSRNDLPQNPELDPARVVALDIGRI